FYKLQGPSCRFHLPEGRHPGGRGTRMDVGTTSALPFSQCPSERPRRTPTAGGGPPTRWPPPGSCCAPTVTTTSMPALLTGPSAPRPPRTAASHPSCCSRCPASPRGPRRPLGATCPGPAVGPHRSTGWAAQARTARGRSLSGMSGHLLLLVPTRTHSRPSSTRGPSGSSTVPCPGGSSSLSSHTN
ncbi:SHANK2 isoform 6, partial [Pan troglodytes]